MRCSRTSKFIWSRLAGPWVCLGKIFDDDELNQIQKIWWRSHQKSFPFIYVKVYATLLQDSAQIGRIILAKWWFCSHFSRHSKVIYKIYLFVHFTFFFNFGLIRLLSRSVVSSRDTYLCDPMLRVGSSEMGIGGKFPQVRDFEKFHKIMGRHY